MKKPFFIDVFPTNDRRTMDYKSSLENFHPTSRYTLMTVGNKRIDPWVLAQSMMEKSPSFSPLIAVNPFYQHPVQIAQKLLSLKTLYPNEIGINIVAGSFFNEMKAMGDEHSFLERSERVKEFCEVLQMLVSGHGPVVYKKKFYKIDGVEIFPKPTLNELNFFISGSLGKDFSTSPNTYFVQSIRPLSEMRESISSNYGLGVGICARESRDDGLKAVKSLYPEDRKGQMLFDLALTNQDTPWNQWLKQYEGKEDSHFYLSPMRNFWSASPFLVGSYEEVSLQLKDYLKLGYGFFILDYRQEDHQHVQEVLSRF